MSNFGEFVYGFMVTALIATILLIGIAMGDSAFKFRGLDSFCPTNSVPNQSPPASGTGPPVAGEGGETG